MLPAEGYDGDPPPFPLPQPSDRELAVWREAWHTPQAFAWSAEHWRWPAIGMWVRWSVRMEADDAPAALGNVTVRLADQIGLTPAGLTENGWRVEDPGEITASTIPPRHVRPGFRHPDQPADAAPLSSLEYARRRAESRQRDPRDALHDEWPAG